MTAPEIIEKLQPKLREEGLEVEFIDRDGAVVNIRARRIAPGVPVAFLVKAIAGTYRRYLPEVEDVCLAEYDSGGEIGTAPSETFEPVFQHQPVASSIGTTGLPVVVLNGLDRRQAIQAIENFYQMWSPKCPVLGVEGASEDAPGRALEKWAHVYSDDYQKIDKISKDRWNIVTPGIEADVVEKAMKQADERMPGKIFIMIEEKG